MFHFRIKKILEDRNSLKYLTSKKCNELPSVEVCSYLKSKRYVIYDKSEAINTEESRSIFKIRKQSFNCIILIVMSKDHLVTCTLGGSATGNLVTRDLEELLDFLKENLD